MPVRKSISALLLSALLLFAAAQLFRPALKQKPHQPLLAASAVPPQVLGIFERACQDCHSDNTRWPWYARTVPVSWLVTHDVLRGRAFMNLSQWQTYGKARQLGYLAAMSNAATTRKMPPPMYAYLHPDARLTPAERRAIATWAAQEYRRLRTRPNEATR